MAVTALVMRHGMIKGEKGGVNGELAALLPGLGSGLFEDLHALTGIGGQKDADWCGRIKFFDDLPRQKGFAHRGRLDPEISGSRNFLQDPLAEALPESVVAAEERNGNAPCQLIDAQGELDG